MDVSEDEVAAARQQAMDLLTCLATSEDGDAAALVVSWTHPETTRVVVSLAAFCDAMLGGQADHLGAAKQELVQLLALRMAARAAGC